MEEKNGLMVHNSEDVLSQLLLTSAVFIFALSSDVAHKHDELLMRLLKCLSVVATAQQEDII